MAALILTLFVGCSDDTKTTTATGTTGGSAGSGGAGSGGASAGGNAGTAGAGGGGEAGAAGAGGTSGGTAGSAGSGTGGSAGQSPEGGSSDGGTSPLMNFFVTSDTSKTGNLGGLAGADARCTRLADAVGRAGGSIVWHAYLSTEALDGGAAVNARDRIGALGPYYNSKGVMVAATMDALHARSGDAEVFLDEKGQKIPGQWTGSPMPVEHDVLTGSTADGMVMAGLTCRNWTSEAMTDTAQVGHADGLGPSMNPAPPYNSWNSSHANAGCNDTAPRGGAGRLYCFSAILPK